jgi:hypothetical protein
LALVVVFRVEIDFAENVQDAVLPEVSDVVGQGLGYRLLLGAVLAERGRLRDESVIELKIGRHFSQKKSHIGMCDSIGFLQRPKLIGVQQAEVQKMPSQIDEFPVRIEEKCQLAATVGGAS